jgi:BlaI family penicillinase repressor
MQAFPRHLSRRERQIMDVLYQKGEASAAEVREALPDAPSYSAVRALLRVLEEKAQVRHVQDGPRYVYTPLQPRNSAARSALRQVVYTFFGGSIEETVTSLLSVEDARLSEEELARLAVLIDKAREEGR